MNATQLSDPWIAAAMNAYLADKDLVITSTALNEFFNGSDGKPGPFAFAGPTEKGLVAYS